jgi:hypothetical protein
MFSSGYSQIILLADIDVKIPEQSATDPLRECGYLLVFFNCLPLRKKTEITKNLNNCLCVYNFRKLLKVTCSLLA